ncbi:MAG TPA: nucleotidyl transferase AbiEii/AbiGii toxin family protein [Kribbella sp.]
MSAHDRYQNPTSFRTALEQRLRAEGLASGIPLNRLRKEAAFNRLLARLCRAAPDAWALKGGLALIARLGAGIRGTNDADANWRTDRSSLENTLSLVEELDLSDWFVFAVGDGRPLRGEGAGGALRFPVTAAVGGRIFEQLSLDVNIVDPADARPIELVVVQRNPFEFVGEPSLRIPMVTPGQQLAEKLHAYTRLYEDERSSRAKDLFDMLVIADQVQLPSGARLAACVEDTFRVRTTDWPPPLVEPPADWHRPWTSFITEYPWPWNTVSAAFTALTEFWSPLLTGSAVATDATWRQELWRWN